MVRTIIEAAGDLSKSGGASIIGIVQVLDLRVQHRVRQQIGTVGELVYRADQGHRGDTLYLFIRDLRFDRVYECAAMNDQEWTAKERRSNRGQRGRDVERVVHLGDHVIGFREL